MDLAYIETADGTRELYDLDGTIGRPDPDELQNRVDDVRYAGLAQDLAALLDSLVHASPRR